MQALNQVVKTTVIHDNRSLKIIDFETDNKLKLLYTVWLNNMPEDNN